MDLRGHAPGARHALRADAPPAEAREGLLQPEAQVLRAPVLPASALSQGCPRLSSLGLTKPCTEAVRPPFRASAWSSQSGRGKWRCSLRTRIAGKRPVT